MLRSVLCNAGGFNRHSCIVDTCHTKFSSGLLLLAGSHRWQPQGLHGIHQYRFTSDVIPQSLRAGSLGVPIVESFVQQLVHQDEILADCLLPSRSRKYRAIRSPRAMVMHADIIEFPGADGGYRMNRYKVSPCMKPEKTMSRSPVRITNRTRVVIARHVVMGGTKQAPVVNCFLPLCKYLHTRTEKSTIGQRQLTAI